MELVGFRMARIPRGQRSGHLTVPLVPGRNKIQVSAMNQHGAESLRKTVYTVYTTEQVEQELYIVAIGVSEYQNSAYNLTIRCKRCGGCHPIISDN